MWRTLSLQDMSQVSRAHGWEPRARPGKNTILSTRRLENRIQTLRSDWWWQKSSTQRALVDTASASAFALGSRPASARLQRGSCKVRVLKLKSNTITSIFGKLLHICSCCRSRWTTTKTRCYVRMASVMLRECKRWCSATHEKRYLHLRSSTLYTKSRSISKPSEKHTTDKYSSRVRRTPAAGVSIRAGGQRQKHH